MREDWVECKLGNLLSVSSGKGLSASKMEVGSFPVYGGNGISGFHSKYIFEEIKLIIGRVGAKCGCVHITQPNAWVTDNALVVNFYFDNPNLKFFKLLLEIENLNKLSNSTAQPVISGAKIHDFNIFLPPLPEQRAIVKKLESLFSSLDAGIADFKKAQQQLKIYRQAVLRKSLDFKETILISELIRDLSQGWSPKCSSENIENDDEWAVIKTTAIQHGAFLPFENKKLPSQLEPKVQHQIVVGDILITRAGPRIRVGVCCLVRKTKLRLINCDKVYRIKLKEGLVLPEYFELVLNSPDYLKLINDIKTGSSDSGLNLTQVRFLKLMVPLPSIRVQKDIIKQIESRLSVCDFIEQSIKESLVKSEALRQSILKKAFEGKLLTAQELAECRKAPDYEPASLLLKRIKAEQKESKPEKKAGYRKEKVSL